MTQTVLDFDKLAVKIFKDRAVMGQHAAEDTAQAIQGAISRKGTISMIFAAAPSQNEYLMALSENPDIPWNKITAFHMDEYIGLPAGSGQSFGEFLKKNIFGKVPFAKVHYLDGNAVDLSAECRRYSDLINRHAPDIVCMGIGENGHIAFNDPHVADFNDTETAKVVTLDLACRTQQVYDECFASLGDVPERALTLTIPALMKPPLRFCIVPGSRKKQAVERALKGKIGEDCPATVLRDSGGTIMYLDHDSSSGLGRV